MRGKNWFIKGLIIGFSILCVFSVLSKNTIVLAESVASDAAMSFENNIENSSENNNTSSMPTAPGIEAENIIAGEILMIDSMNQYAGMNLPYSQGYSPSVQQNNVSICLPLIEKNIAKGNIDSNTIIATIDLGAPDSSPFIFANYEKIINLNSQQLSNNQINDCYFIRFDIPLKTNKIIGAYPIQIKTKYTLNNGQTMEQMFPLFVNITEGIDPNITPTPIPTPAPEPTPEPRNQPKIILNHYEVSSDSIMAGDSFAVQLHFENNDPKWEAKNIAISINGSDDTLLVDGKNTYFLEELMSKEIKSIQVPFRTTSATDDKSHKIQIILEYEDNVGTPYSSNTEFWVQVTQPIRLVADEISLPVEVYSGESMVFSMNVFNMGKSQLSNVLCEMSMSGATPDGAAFLGNLESGSSSQAEIFIFWGPINVDVNGKFTGTGSALQYGETTGTITLSYEDQYGEKYSQEIEISTTILEPTYMFEENTADLLEPEEEEKKETYSQWWVSIILVAGIGMIIYGYTAYQRKLKKLRRKYGDEDI